MHLETGLFLSRITNCCISLPNDLFIYFPLFAHPFYFISCTIVSTCIQISFHFLSKPLLKCFVFSKTRGIATRFACLLLLLLSQDDVMIIPSLFSLPFLTCSSFSSNVIFVCCLFQKKNQLKTNTSVINIITVSFLSGGSVMLLHDAHQLHPT